MNIIGQGSTPYLALQVVRQDLGSADVIHVTVQQARHQLDLTGDRIDVAVEDGTSTLTAHLTQEETLAFSDGIATIQVRWRNPDGEAYVTRCVNVNFFMALYREVI